MKITISENGLKVCELEGSKDALWVLNRLMNLVATDSILTVVAEPEPQLPDHSGEREELTFDGCGINGPDEYRTQMAKFTTSAISKGLPRRYGPMFAAAPELLAALDHCREALAVRADYWQNDIEEYGYLLDALEAAEKALAKVKT
jgi:hypothetical protein